MLKRIKYASRQEVPMDRAAIDALVAKASASNAAVGVTGALMVTGTVFFQILEGPTAAVDALFAKIAADPRHTDVVCLSEQDGREMRLFPEWGMRRVSLDETNTSIKMEAIVRQLWMTEGSERAAMADELARLMRADLRSAA